MNSASRSNSNNGALPSQILHRVFAYVFWEAPRRRGDGCGLSDHASRHFGTVSTMPVGHSDILGALHTCHHWRKRAARLFYGTAVMAVGQRAQAILEEHEQPTDLRRRHIATNVALLMDSGYAPKTRHLLVYAHTPVTADQMAQALFEFSQWQWPVIDTLYYYDPQMADRQSSQWAHDQAVGLLNRQLAASLPALQKIIAMSATRDSFGLFVLDDLVLAKRAQLRTLEALATVGSLSLLAPDIHGFTLALESMTMRAPHTADVLRIPMSVAPMLFKLDIGPIAPDAIWAPFATSGELGDFLRLRFLRLEFVSHQAAAVAAAAKHRRQGSGASADSVHSGTYPLFPELCELVVSRYPFDISAFLENFPRCQIRHLSLVRCPWMLDGFSLQPFTALQSASFELTTVHPGRPSDDDAVSQWVAQTLQQPTPALNALSIIIPASLDSYETELPAGSRLYTLQHLTLDIGLRLDDLEELLLSLPQLVTLRVVAAEVHTKAHEYLSRRARPKKYPVDRKRRRAVLSDRLVLLCVRLSTQLAAGRRRRRALAKTAWLAARIPSVLKILTQSQLVGALRECVHKAAAVKSAPHNTGHLAAVTIGPVF
ncbi:hypothetical protein FB645_001951 [Coemansia sp. IMI 203386]|nr:hypothetical protein FB645_001951 [Coemansia sp. IMI 203386]